MKVLINLIDNCLNSGRLRFGQMLIESYAMHCETIEFRRNYSGSQETL